MKLKALLVDDEPHCLDTLRFDLKRSCEPLLEIVGEANQAINNFQTISGNLENMLSSFVNEDSLVSPSNINITESIYEEIVTHLVEEGDTLSEIAKEYGVSVEDIQTLNSIENPDSIMVGQEVVVKDIYIHTVTVTPKSQNLKQVNESKKQ